MPFETANAALDHLDSLTTEQAVTTVLHGVNEALKAEDWEAVASLLVVLNRYSHSAAEQLAKIVDEHAIPYEPNFEEINRVLAYPRPAGWEGRES